MKTRIIAVITLGLALALTAFGQATNSWTDGNGKWENSNNWSLAVAPSTIDGADLITNVGNNTVTIDAITSGSFPNSLTINNLYIAGTANSTNTLALTNAGFATPLYVLYDLNLSNNSTVVINNSALQVDGMLSVGLTLGAGNQLIVTNGGQLVSALAIVGGVPSSSNSVVVTGSGSTWVNTNDTLAVRNNTPGTAIMIANGASMKAGGVFIGDLPNCNSNVVLVTDPGSSWSNMFTLSVGGPNHDDQFVISNGASVYTWNAIIGYPVGHNHSALITGSNSLWTTDGPIAVGIGGTGDSLTVADGGALIVSNASHTAQVVVNGATLFLGTGTFKPDNLIITNGGAVQYTQTYQVDNANVTVASGTVQAGSNYVVAASANSTGTVAVTTGGALTVTNGVLGIGNDGTITSGGGVGLLTVSNGTLQASTILLGSSAGGQGDLILGNGGTISCSAGTNCLIVINSLGFDQIGGDLVWSGSTLECGVTRSADYSISGGAASFQDLYVGYSDMGTMTLAGGVANVSSRLIIGHLGSPLSDGTVWITGGQLSVPNSYTIIGNSGVGQMTISNGTMTAASAIVGNSSNPGSLTVAGGTMTVLSDMTLGDCGGGMMGFVTITGGNLFVTNAAHNATLDVRSGSFIMTGGAVVVDRLVMTNACGLFQRTGGALQYSQLLLDPNLSAVGDGIPNSWKQKYGLDPFDPNLANEDSDGDGLSNLREYQLGTDPNNASSPFRITAIAREGNNIRVTWTTVGSTTNFVQVTAGTANGSYTNNFSDLSPELTILGSTVTSTNYLDLNGATNVPARYYRIRLVP